MHFHQSDTFKYNYRLFTMALLNPLQEQLSSEMWIVQVCISWTDAVPTEAATEFESQKSS